MSDALIRYQDGTPAAFRNRRRSRELAQLSDQTELCIAAVEARAEIEATKVDAVTYVGRRALYDVALLTQLEQQLAQMVPLAASRLQAVGDMTALALADLVASTVNKVNRTC
ncbi:MAG: hypothetical protein QOG53_1395 [Frankiales bacterium]|jgi:hypothetical protein|nr:hypothetical protein [Frankiales bacterium]